MIFFCFFSIFCLTSRRYNGAPALSCGEKADYILLLRERQTLRLRDNDKDNRRIAELRASSSKEDLMDVDTRIGQAAMEKMWNETIERNRVGQAAMAEMWNETIEKNRAGQAEMWNETTEKKNETVFY